MISHVIPGNFPRAYNVMESVLLALIKY